MTNAGNDVFASCSQIAIYFAWLGFYTGWLLPAAVVGVLVFLYGVATMYSNRIAIETCTEGHDVRKVKGKLFRFFLLLLWLLARLSFPLSLQIHFVSATPSSLPNPAFPIRPEGGEGKRPL